MHPHGSSPHTPAPRSQEAKPYKEEREVVAMRNLILAFQNHDVKAFETILKVLVCLLLYALLPPCPRPLISPLSSLQTHRQALTRDTFVRAHIDQLLITIRTQVRIRQLCACSTVKDMRERHATLMPPCLHVLLSYWWTLNGRGLLS